MTDEETLKSLLNPLPRKERVKVRVSFLSSFLNISIRNLNYLRTKACGFPIKDFGNDKRGG